MEIASVALPILIALIIVALIFDFLNGLHDAANSIATIVSTRALSPRAAVIWAAFFNFIAFLVFGLHVANTVGKGIISPEVAAWMPNAVFGIAGAIDEVPQYPSKYSSAIGPEASRLAWEDDELAKLVAVGETLGCGA